MCMNCSVGSRVDLLLIDDFLHLLTLLLCCDYVTVVVMLYIRVLIVKWVVGAVFITIGHWSASHGAICCRIWLDWFPGRMMCYTLNYDLTKLLHFLLYIKLNAVESIITTRCTTVQSAVLRSHVRPSVRLSDVYIYIYTFADCTGPGKCFMGSWKVLGFSSVKEWEPWYSLSGNIPDCL